MKAVGIVKDKVVTVNIPIQELELLNKLCLFYLGITLEPICKESVYQLNIEIADTLNDLLNFGYEY